MITQLQSVPRVQEIPANKGAPVYEVIERPDSKGVQNTSNLPRVNFSQQSSKATSGMPYREGEKVSKMPKMIDLESNGFSRSARL